MANGLTLLPGLSVLLCLQTCHSMQRRPCWHSCPRCVACHPLCLPLTLHQFLHAPICACCLCPPLCTTATTLHNCCLPGCIQVGGYTVLEVSVDLQTVCVMEGLTEDAVYARIYDGEQLS